MIKPLRLLEKYIPLPATYSSEAMQISSGVTYIGDSSKAKAELGYQPRALSVGLAETLGHEMKLLGMKR